MPAKPPQGPGDDPAGPKELANPVRVEHARADDGKTPQVEARVRLEGNDRLTSASGSVPFWMALRNRRIGFNDYATFVGRALSNKDDVAVGLGPRAEFARRVASKSAVPRSADGRNPCDINLAWLGRGINAYELLKTATEIFLLLRCGLERKESEAGEEVDGGDRFDPPMDADALTSALAAYMGSHTRLPYIKLVVQQTFAEERFTDSPFADGILASRADCPCFFELIWSYWHEEGMLVQALNALSRRFQNLHGPGDRDPLAQLELSPLRPLSGIFWGYVQDEQQRLSLARRSYEYEHEYGLYLRGKAVPQRRSAERRSKFIEAFHDLLYRCSVFYHESSNLQFVPDPFPLLNGLKEVHSILSQGAGNQFGELPFTARVEMLIQQWIMARPEIGNFLGRRPMVVYDETWMANVDAMKTVMGWTDTSITHFHNLAVFGEKLLLSIRWEPWATETSAETARQWAVLFRDLVQGYTHAYRAATGVDLTQEARGGDRNQNPSLLLHQRLEQQRAVSRAL